MLSHLMQDTALLEELKLHCTSELCSENLFFLIHVKQFEKIRDQKDLQETATIIYNDFIKDNSEFEINLSVKHKKEIQSIIEGQESINASMFNGIVFHIECLLSDSLARFDAKIQEKKKQNRSRRFSNFSKSIKRIQMKLAEKYSEKKVTSISSPSTSPPRSPSHQAPKYIQEVKPFSNKFFFDEDDDELISVADWLNTKKEFNGSFQLSKKTTIVNFNKSNNYNQTQ